MFKKPLVKMLFITTILMLVFTMTVSAASTTKSLSTNYTLVNLGAEKASVTVDYFKDDGTTWAVDPANSAFDIAANYGQMQVRQYFDTTMAAGKGSVVVKSNTNLGAVVQIQARGQTPTQGAYSGYTAGSNKFYVPLAAHNKTTASGIANSQIVIQNADQSNLDVTIDLYNGPTKTYTKSITALKPGVSFYYDLADETNLGASWLGSAVVTAFGTGKIVVVSNFFTGSDAMQTYNAFPAENVTTKWVAPLFFSRLGNGLSTVVTVQNLSGGDIPANAVTLSCVRDSSATPTSLSVQNPALIASNASYSFNPVTDTTLFPDAKWGGSCTLDSGGYDTVVIVQMRYVGGSLAGAAAYEAMPASSTGKTVVVPLVAKRLSNGFASVVTIQNMSTTAKAHVTLTYTPSSSCALAICDKNSDGKLDASDVVTVSSIEIAEGASIQRNHRIVSGVGAETDLPDRWEGSMVAVSSDENINGFTQLTNISITAGDTFMAHDAFVLP